MKALSLWNPWATLLVHGAKQVETRGWPISHRGPLLIHAAKKWDGELEELCYTEPFASALEKIGALEAVADRLALPFGAILGRVEVVECYPAHAVRVNGSQGVSGASNVLWIDATERAFGDYSPGRFAFLCANPVAFAKPIPFPGKQGLFEVPDNLLPKDV